MNPSSSFLIDGENVHLTIDKSRAEELQRTLKQKMMEWMYNFSGGWDVAEKRYNSMYRIMPVIYSLDEALAAIKAKETERERERFTKQPLSPSSSPYTQPSHMQQAFLSPPRFKSALDVMLEKRREQYEYEMSKQQHEDEQRRKKDAAHKFTSAAMQGLGNIKPVKKVAKKKK